jgi:molybdate/tungstate transport system substrate-binding protein
MATSAPAHPPIPNLFFRSSSRTYLFDSRDLYRIKSYRHTFAASNMRHMTRASKSTSRREFLSGGASLFLAAVLAGFPGRSSAAGLGVLDVAYGGSMTSVMEGPVKSAVARALHLEIHGRAQGSNALSNLIVGGSIRPDVLIAVTPGPVMTVLRAGKANSAEPIAHTEIVIAYSPKSRFAAKFEAAASGKAKWWEILQEPHLRFGRTDPIADPQGRNIIFTMTLAAKLYGQPNLVQNTLGPAINEKQIFSEPTVLARLQSGELDAASAYKIQPGPFKLPFIALPKSINLSSQDVREQNPDLKLTLGNSTYYPEPLIFYAAALNDAPNPKGASEFLQWLKSSEAQSIFRRYQYDPPDRASALRA